MALTRNPRPWVITLQEVCSPTYVRIRDALVPQGYTPDRIITQSGIEGCDHFGLAMFTLGAVGPFDSQSLGGNRAIGCRVKGTYAGQFKFCVTHTLYQSQVDAAGTFYFNSSGSMSYDHRLIGGDFNVLPSGAWVYYAYDNELDYRSPPANTFDTQHASPKVKIDYLFMDMPSWRVPNRLCEYWRSDHCYLYGNFLV